MIIIPIFMILWSCSGGDDSSISSKMQRQIENEPHPGEKLIEKHCYLCHNQESQEDGRIGPPMTHVKMHYLDAYPEQAEFTKQLISFVQNPTEDHSIMPGALKKFGLMPKQQFTPETLEQIADYLFTRDIEPLKKSVSTIDPGDYAERGLAVALSIKKVLGQNLMTAMQQKGPLHALEFCNLRAIPLTDSMRQVHGVYIQRVSERNRNPDNRATALETKYIQQFQDEINKSIEISPLVIENNTNSIVYYPIITNDMCLKCHGTPEKAVAEKIRALYPDDLATGYTENQVRGVWKIVFPDTH